MKLEFLWEILKKYINIKFHENLSSGSWVPCRQTDRQAHMTEVIAAFCDFQTCPKSSPDIMPQRQRGGVEVQLYSFFNFGTIYVGEWSTPHPSHFMPGKSCDTHLKRTDGPRGLSGWVLLKRKFVPLLRIEPRTDQHIASRYTGYAILSPTMICPV
jgi:hypothetical protein